VSGVVRLAQVTRHRLALLKCLQEIENVESKYDEFQFEWQSVERSHRVKEQSDFVYLQGLREVDVCAYHHCATRVLSSTDMRVVTENENEMARRSSNP